MPGPNAYDPTEPQAHYKRGAMYEKDARFKAGQAQRLAPSPPPMSTSPTLPCSCTKRGVSPSSGRVLSLEKEKTRLETRLQKAEEQAQDLMRQKADTNTEKARMQTDLRILNQKYEKAQEQLQKTARKDASQKSTVHEQLQEARQALEEERKAHRNELNRMSSHLVAAEHERRESCEAQRVLKLELHVAREKQLSLEELQRKLQEPQSLDIHSLDDGTNEEKERVDGLKRQCEALIKCAFAFAQAFREEQEQHRQAQQDVRLCFLARYNTRTEHLDENNEAEDRLSGVLDDEGHQTTHGLDRLGETSCDGKKSALPSAIDAWKHGVDWHEMAEILRRRQMALATSSALIQEHDRIRLELAEERCAWLNERLDELHGQYLYLLQKYNAQADMQREFDKLRGELAIVEEAYEAGVAERAQAKREAKKLGEDVKAARKEKADLAHEIVLFEAQSAELAQIKTAGDLWQREKSTILEEIARSAHYEAAYAELHTEAQTLIAKLAARDIQADELTSMNATLTSHANPQQRILCIDRVRRQLDETRLQSCIFEGERDQLRSQVRALQAQLEVFRHIGKSPQPASATLDATAPTPELHANGNAVSPSDASALHRAQTDMVGLGLELDMGGMTESDRERLAARLAWQQRPRTKAVRVLREQRSSPRLRMTNTQAEQGGQKEQAAVPLLPYPPRRIASSSAAFPVRDAARDAGISDALPHPSSPSVASSTADSSSVLLSPDSAATSIQASVPRPEGFFGRLCSTPARFVKSVGNSPAMPSGRLIEASDDSPIAAQLGRSTNGNSASDRMARFLNGGADGDGCSGLSPSPLSFAMPLDDGDFSLEDLAP